MKILLVDDDDGMLVIWQRFLKPLEAEILTAHGVDEAIAQMREVPPPDVLLLDLVLPPHAALDTVEAIQKLRQFNPDLTVIIISGMDERRLLETVANVHVEGVLHKGDKLTQSVLLQAMKVALAASPNSGELLRTVSAIVDNLVSEETKKKSQQLG